MGEDIDFGDDPEPVVVPSADGRTILSGCLWRAKASGRRPTVVMMHGRTGAYVPDAEGVFSARRLLPRHRMWGNHWRMQEYGSLFIDRFGSRGYVNGFPSGSYASRPPEVSERFVRPLDALGALFWLQGRSFVDTTRVLLQGWSNGAMAALWTMRNDMVGRAELLCSAVFERRQRSIPGVRSFGSRRRYRPFAPVLMLLAEDDRETSRKTCVKFALEVTARGGAMTHHVYPGASHNFDDPRKTDAAHQMARIDALARVLSFFQGAIA